MSEERDPRRGWWTPEHRAHLEALERGAPADELAELELAACRAGDALAGTGRRLNAIAAAAIGIGLVVDERRWSEARRLVDELVDAVDDWRAEQESEGDGLAAVAVPALPPIPPSPT